MKEECTEFKANGKDNISEQSVVSNTNAALEAA